MHLGGARATIPAMRHRRVSIVVATAAAFALLAATASATISHHTFWKVSARANQSQSWSFSADDPEECSGYYGTSSQYVKGSGSNRLSFATTKNRPLYAETSVIGGKLRFSSFSTDGGQAPGNYSIQGTTTYGHGKPCGSDATDPEPLPTFAETSGCGSKQVVFSPNLYWSKGRITLAASPYSSFFPICPGPFDAPIRISDATPCTPSDLGVGTGNRLVELRANAAGSDFKKGKKFTVGTSKDFDCEYPTLWSGSPTQHVRISTSYSVTFKPYSP